MKRSGIEGGPEVPLCAVYGMILVPQYSGRWNAGMAEFRNLSAAVSARVSLLQRRHAVDRALLVIAAGSRHTEHAFAGNLN